MSNKAIRAALEARLLAMPDGIDRARTHFSNVKYVPVSGQPYQEVTIMPAPPFNYAGTSLRKRLSGIFQVKLAFPYGAGPGLAEEAAERLQAWFPQGLSVEANNVTTRIDRTPDIRPGRVEGDRWVVPVRVTYFANI